MSGTPRLSRVLTPRLSDRQRLGKPPITVYAWGRGDLGQLGLGEEEEEDRDEPTPVKALEGKDVVSVAAGEYHSAFLTSDGEVYVAGNNDSGQLGVGSHTPQPTPVRVAALDTRTITHVACGQAHSVAVTDAGALASWGASELGQLGQKEAAEVTDVAQPRIVKGSREMRFARVACGATHTLALTGAGEVYSFGQGNFGALGHGSLANALVPQHVFALWGFAIVQNHSAALSLDGRVFAWGWGKYGQLGLGTTANEASPRRVRDQLSRERVVQIACGSSHTMALSSDGAVFSWGQGRWGQTGHGHERDTLTPALVRGLSHRAAVQIAAGSRHSLAVTDDSQVFGWGEGERCQLGRFEGPTSQLTPRALKDLPGEALEQRLLFVTAGGEHSFAVYQRRRLGGSSSALPTPATAATPQPLRPIQEELQISPAAAAAGAAGGAHPEPEPAEERYQGPEEGEEAAGEDRMAEEAVHVLRPDDTDSDSMEVATPPAVSPPLSPRPLLAIGSPPSEAVTFSPTSSPSLHSEVFMRAAASPPLASEDPPGPHPSSAYTHPDSHPHQVSPTGRSEAQAQEAGAGQGQGGGEGARGSTLLQPQQEQQQQQQQPPLPLPSTDILLRPPLLGQQGGADASASLLSQGPPLRAADGAGADAGGDAADDGEGLLCLGPALQQQPEVLAEIQSAVQPQSVLQPEAMFASHPSREDLSAFMGGGNSTAAAATEAEDEAMAGGEDFSGAHMHAHPAAAPARIADVAGGAEVDSESRGQDEHGLGGGGDGASTNGTAEIGPGGSARTHPGAGNTEGGAAWGSDRTTLGHLDASGIGHLASRNDAVGPSSSSSSHEENGPVDVTGGSTEMDVEAPALPGAAGEEAMGTGAVATREHEVESGTRMGLMRLPLAPPDVLAALQDAKASGQVAQLEHVIEEVFRSPGFLVHAFRLHPEEHAELAGMGAPSAHTPSHNLHTWTATEGEGPGLDIWRLRTFYQELLELYNADVLKRLAATAGRLLEGMEKYSGRVPDPRWIRALLVLLQCPLIGEQGVGDAMSTRLFMIFVRLSAAAENQVVAWLATYPRDVFGGRFLRGVHKYITNRQQALGGRAIPPDIAAAVKVLGVLHAANQRASLVPYGDLYSTAISQHASLKVPYVLNPIAKSHILQGEAALEKSQQVHATLVQHALGNPHTSPVLLLVVMGQTLILEDLKEVQPQLGKGLQQLLDTEADVAATFALTFQVEYEYFGEMRSHELLPGGAHLTVTNDNRQRYVELYVDYVLRESIREQFAAFSRGFLQPGAAILESARLARQLAHLLTEGGGALGGAGPGAAGGRVCGGPALSLFRHEELELLICGLPHFDFDVLERVCKYEGGFTQSSPPVLWLWQVVRAMSFEEKKKLLFFTTGSDRAPIGGLGTLNFVVMRNGPDSDR
eukprot:jgi/Mesen1/2031/ME000148S01136